MPSEPPKPRHNALQYDESPLPKAPEANPGSIKIVKGVGNVGVAIAIATVPIVIVVILLIFRFSNCLLV